MTAPFKARNRLGHTKSRGGCVTCKRRRVKCGEEKPVCIRCTRAGRKCDGYEDIDGSFALSSRALVTTSPEQDRALNNSGLDNEEQRLFQFFTTTAAPQIAGFGTDDFWTRLLPQYSHTEPAVRYALLSIGSLVLQSTITSTEPELSKALSLRYLSLKHYNRAIDATLTTLNTNCGREELAAITCILFVCIEALQGHEAEAVALFGQVHNTLASALELNDRSKDVKIHADITTAFSHLTVLCSMFNPSPAQPDIIYYIAFFKSLPSTPNHLNSISQARHELMELLRIVQSIVFVGSNLKWSKINLKTHPGVLAIQIRQKEVHQALQKWYNRLTEFTNRNHNSARQTIPVKERIMTSVLIAQYQLITVWLDSNLHRDQTSQDTYMSQFDKAVQESSTAISLMSTNNTLTPFTYEMGLIPSLYWTAIRCRDPILRRQALSLLSQAPIREGLWDRRIVLKVAQRVIQLEEDTIESFIDSDPGAIANANANANARAGLDLGLDPTQAHSTEIKVVVPPALASDSPDIHTFSRYPPEEKRIHVVQIHHRTSVAGRQGDYVDFLSLPTGFEGGWDIRREFVTLE